MYILTVAILAEKYYRIRERQTETERGREKDRETERVRRLFSVK